MRLLKYFSNLISLLTSYSNVEDRVLIVQCLYICAKLIQYLFRSKIRLEDNGVVQLLQRAVADAASGRREVQST